MSQEKQLQKIINKKALRKIDWNIVVRMLTFLRYNSKIKKTNMAMKCTMGYDRCILYLHWLDNIGLIKKESDAEGFEVISLSDKGLELCQRNFMIQKIF